ncbi:hypothetical protein Enr10x_52600 [Gimesia panareensis]|uniref:Uncharacterized protein n=1 Tax=Gimesia panareensis TaxID=2527978 RepID=A0A517QE45_9PLAN|nr:hypothetical protein [Gimesia panareensis]QDT29903.1 hypothetical protein Enr10x_52600 [Gimesia panareensis]
MRYARSLSPRFVDHLSREPLSQLLQLPELCAQDDDYTLDLQLRAEDRLVVYHGSMSLLRIEYDNSTNCLSYSANASEDYFNSATGSQELMQSWLESSWSRTVKMIPEYLLAAISFEKDGYYRNRARGYWLNRLSLTFGSRWCPGMDWLIIDRDAVLSYPNGLERKILFGPIQRKYDVIRDKLKEQDSQKWGEPSPSTFRDMCDFFALGPGGELLCIELKHGSDTSRICWGGLQAAVHRELFGRTLDQITDDIKSLVRQKVQLGLLPSQAAERLPEERFRTVQPILVIAEPNYRSNCWELLQEVATLCHEAQCSVVEVRNDHELVSISRSWQ